MSKYSSIDKAVTLLRNKYNVIAEKYTVYNGAYLIMAYPPGVINKDQYLSPWYLVDVDKKLVGPFSAAFDLNGFFEAVKHLRDI